MEPAKRVTGFCDVPQKPNPLAGLGYRPKLPRTAVFPFPNTSYAAPNRGLMSFALIPESCAGNTIAVGLMRETVSSIADNYRTAFGLGAREARRRARRLFYSYGLTTVDLFRIRAGGERAAPRISFTDAGTAACH